jgi:hypothetical protein
MKRVSAQGDTRTNLFVKRALEIGETLEARKISIEARKTSVARCCLGGRFKNFVPRSINILKRIT